MNLAIFQRQDLLQQPSALLRYLRKILQTLYSLDTESVVKEPAKKCINSLRNVSSPISSSFHYFQKIFTKVTLLKQLPYNDIKYDFHLAHIKLWHCSVDCCGCTPLLFVHCGGQLAAAVVTLPTQLE
jgi:hypothetical protein